MIKGIGTDITSVSRIKKIMDKNRELFLNKILSPAEQEIIPEKGSEHFIAGRFAAKEAIVKALGYSFNFSQVTILNDRNGKPFIANPANLLQDNRETTLHISISHEKKYATAVAILEKNIIHE